MIMSEQYPLYPELSEAGNEEAQALIDKFKESLKKVADEAISDFYCDVAVHIESDSWSNYRNEMMAGFRNYDNRKVQGEYDFKEIRQAILKNHREDIITDLNQDMLKEIESLKEHIAFQDRLRENRY
jgi:hypothetical protein